MKTCSTGTPGPSASNATFGRATPLIESNRPATTSWSDATMATDEIRASELVWASGSLVTPGTASKALSTWPFASSRTKPARR